MHEGLSPIEIPQAATLRNPLSEREQTVLRYLACTLSAADMASELDASRNNVKTHTNGTYHKLGVDRRREAVNQARHLGLL
jgi:LuxR family maltose regulon positive regulatory protein